MRTCSSALGPALSWILNTIESYETNFFGYDWGLILIGVL
jgi:hypothetical protein